MANGRLPSPGEVFTPLVGIEGSLQSAVQTPFRTAGIPAPPIIPGPAAFIQRVLATLPAPQLFN